jgi:prepilin-type processing-associated H-X9-DG protein
MFKSQSKNPSRVGFTLLELLVMIAIIGALLAIFLPAAQSARDLSRRASCKNNLSQIGLALHNHVNVTKFFPPGHTDYGDKSNAKKPDGMPLGDWNQHSWVTLLLPYLGEEQLAREYSFKFSSLHPINRSVIETDLALLTCPSYEHKDKGRSDYAGINGTRALTTVGEGYWPSQSYSKGIMVAVGMARDPRDPTKAKNLGNVPIRPKYVTDGLSKTLTVVECAGRMDDQFQWAYAHQTFVQNSPIHVSRSNEMCSEHPGGVHVSFADGHVVFMSENTPLTLIDKLATRAGREQVHDHEIE